MVYPSQVLNKVVKNLFLKGILFSCIPGECEGSTVMDFILFHNSQICNITVDISCIVSDKLNISVSVICFSIFCVNACMRNIKCSLYHKDACFLPLAFPERARVTRG